MMPSFCIISSNLSHCISYDFFSFCGGTSAEFLVVLQVPCSFKKTPKSLPSTNFFQSVLSTVIQDWKYMFLSEVFDSAIWMWRSVQSFLLWQLIVQVCVSVHHMGTLPRLGSPGRPLLIALPLSWTCGEPEMPSACQMRSVFPIFLFLCFRTRWSLSVSVCWVSPEIKPFSVACCLDPIKGWKLLLTSVIFGSFSLKKRK